MGKANVVLETARANQSKLSFLYLISFLDRTNIGNAKVDGLVDDLGMTDNPQRYGICLTVFFISYSIFEPLTNVLLKRWRPSRFIPAIMIAWGICMTCMGLVKDFGGLVTTRFFLGITEAGVRSNSAPSNASTHNNDSSFPE